MIDFRLYTRVKTLEQELDNTMKLVQTLRRQQENMLDQIQKLKNIAKQNEERVDGRG